MFVALAVGLAQGALGCATVKPQEHATLADPTMRFDDDARARAQMEHALDNREAAVRRQRRCWRRLRLQLSGARPESAPYGSRCATIAASGAAHAQAVTVDTTHSFYTEAPTGSHMTIYTPGVDLEASPMELAPGARRMGGRLRHWGQRRGEGWPAYQANHPDADVITAASVNDFRNRGTGASRCRARPSRSPLGTCTRPRTTTGRIRSTSLRARSSSSTTPS